MHLRRLLPHEVSLHRELRLRALRDAPDSFGEAAAEVALRPLTYWEGLTRSVTEPGPHVMFLAVEAELVVGSTYGLRDQDRSEAGRVGGMWVDPAWRRRGVGGALLQAVFGWARERGLNRLGLWAPAHSPAALTLYRQAGFRENGNRRPLATNPALQIIELEAPL
jgi:GNAT superfamily N-acetyltransferase